MRGKNTMATIHKPFKYVRALETDIRQTFKREWQRLRELEQAKHAAAPNVTPIGKERERRTGA
jgi:hypothetical protein